MKYQEIYNEYTGLLNEYCKLHHELCLLPKGTVVRKRISGKDYYYLQYTSFGKKKTEYLRECDIDETCIKLEQGKDLRIRIEVVYDNINRVEKAVRILDSQMSRLFVFLRQCADMDALPLNKRTNALSFANAMVALEGISAKQETEENLRAWAMGEKRFADFYLPTLARYKILEDYDGT